MIEQVTITNTTGFIVLTWPSAKPVSIDKIEIMAIIENPRHNSVQIDCGNGGRFYSGGIEFYLDRLASPAVASLSDLATLLRAYAQNPQGTPNAFTYHLTAGTTVVSFSPAMTTSNYKILIYNPSGVGFDAPTLLNDNNFTITNVIADCDVTIALFY